MTGESVTANGGKDNTEEKKAGDETAANRGLSSFFGRRQVAADKEPATSDPAAAENNDEDAKAPESPTQTPATGLNAQNRFTKWRQAAASAINAGDEVAQPQQDQPTPQAPAPVPATGAGRFGGAFGMLRKTSNDGSNDPAANSNPQPTLRRNPFARFGGGGAAAPPAAKAAVNTATSAFGGFMKAAQNNRPNFRRGASNDAVPDQPKEPQPAATGTVVSLPPLPDETTGEQSTGTEGGKDESPKKVEPNLRAV